MNVYYYNSVNSHLLDNGEEINSETENEIQVFSVDTNCKASQQWAMAVVLKRRI